MYKMTPYCRSTIWGGSRLFDCFPYVDLPNLAEAWLFSIVCDGESRVLGEGLLQVLKKEGIDDATLSALPLIKLIDTADLLSVQVHPNDEEARHLDGQPHGKNEMWYILSAEPNAFVYLNLKSTKAAFLAALDEGRPTDEMQKVFVKKGDVLLLPAGMVHALGKGITLLEIQQQSDLTYRLWDFERLDQNGNPRPLHTEKAKAVLKAFTAEDILSFRYAEGDKKSYQISVENKPNMTCIANTPYFSVDIAHISPDNPLTLSSMRKPVVLVSVEGEGKAQAEKDTLTFGFGETLCFLPADGEVKVTGHTQCAIISIPSLS